MHLMRGVNEAVDAKDLLLAISNETHGGEQSTWRAWVAI